MPESQEPDSLAALVRFGRLLRGRGLPVGTGRIVTFCRAAVALQPVDRDRLYWAGRTSLVGRREDFATYDAAFDEWFAGHGPAMPDIELDLTGREGRESESDVEVQLSRVAASWSAAGDEEPEPGEDAAIRLVASPAEVLRTKSFGDLDDEERARVATLIRELALRMPTRHARRTRPAHKGATFDLRRTLRRSLRTHGEPFERAWRDRKTRARPLVLILDVSGSMSAYARALMQFAYAAMATGRRVEVFVFGTRLTRVTRVLRRRDPDRALREIGQEVPDWEGGTRIGESLKSLLDGWSQRAALRGGVVVVCSDGLERDDPDLLRTQMARLRRLAHRVVWVNPLKGSPRYEPLARGMAAALPSIDVFVSGHNLESIEELGRVIGA